MGATIFRARPQSLARGNEGKYTFISALRLATDALPEVRSGKGNGKGKGTCFGPRFCLSNSHYSNVIISKYFLHHRIRQKATINSIAFQSHHRVRKNAMP